MKTKHVLATVLTLSLLGSAAGFAAELEREGLTITQSDSVSMVLSTQATFGSATLRVAGPAGYLVEQTFDSGSVAHFDLLAGAADPQDGTYTWELIYSSPVGEELAQRLSEARQVGDEAFADRMKAEGQFVAGSWNGSFLVLDGRMIVPEARSAELGDSDRPLPTKDFLIQDDLIVDGSACVGFDCVNGEDFGFDTIRLKENNLRIKFQDTSGGAAFPTNDWQITINDSANGGLNKFSIDDIDSGRTPMTIEARAPSHSLYVDDGGRLGLGTSIPVVDLHVVSGNSPTLRLEQNGSSGFTPQTWDVAGNEANFFVRDVTNGSRLPLRIRPTADSDTLVLDAESQVGIGVLNATHKLHVVEQGSAGDLRIVSKLENNGPASLQLLDTASGDNWVFTNKPTGFEISKGGTGVIEMRLDGAGDLFIEGQLTTGMNVYPDYVFDEGYDLMPLDELASFIESNGHLPNIKPEDEVEYGKRVNLSELSRGLLEKVEELTLYTLEQHRTDAELRRTIDRQNRLIEDLEARLAALEAGR